MYINPFVAGVLTTIFAELLIGVIWGIVSTYKENKK